MSVYSQKDLTCLKLSPKGTINSKKDLTCLKGSPKGIIAAFHRTVQSFLFFFFFSKFYFINLNHHKSQKQFIMVNEVGRFQDMLAVMGPRPPRYIKCTLHFMNTISRTSCGKLLRTEPVYRVEQAENSTIV